MARPPAHDSNVPEILAAAHHPKHIRTRLSLQKNPSYLKDFIYGAIDGAVTTFAVVSGVAGAGLSSSIVLILGVANLIGDGFSMAAGNFLGTQAELEQMSKLRQMEQQHINEVPDGEREEIRQIFREKGFEGELLDRVVEVITADDHRWIETMLQEEHGVSLTRTSPWRAATTTFVAFLFVGAIPLIPFVFSFGGSSLIQTPFLASTALTGVAFFAVGAFKSRFVEQHWLRAGLETLLVGGLAAGLAYLCGLALGGLK
ncbi:VIT family protein [Thalassoglobus neptunius]|uniref:VIT family protein n=1 Tax=Thalassoglobus neptunius TaxID=1938619 RepID=A0A5C5WZ48_9PLAN|nr:VIT1/CCC1 transporter family protein [Thalassoglobus neptunius]TWT55830.1 VIT family protein [Thalassoglobus neptunius]